MYLEIQCSPETFNEIMNKWGASSPPEPSESDAPPKEPDSE